MICRTATINDLPNLVDIAKEFMAETNWGWTFNEDFSLESFYKSIIHPECDVVLCLSDGNELLGAAIVAIENDFQVESVGDILEFYISAKARGTGAGRELLSSMCKWFDSRKCVNVFVKATANIGNDQAFINLFKKFGFKVSSVVLVR